MAGIDLITMNRKMSDNPLYIYNDDGDRTDISTAIYPETHDIHNGFEEIDRKGNEFDVYMYNGIKVPRVSSILEYCTGDNRYIVDWASRLGSDYHDTRRSILDIGHAVHSLISDYLSAGTVQSIDRYNRKIQPEIKCCFQNFLDWYSRIKSIGWEIEIVASEIPLISPWFGGTADLIIKLNRRTYIMDFKTSKDIKPIYIVQACAYKWLVDNYHSEYGPIDGIGILRLDKYKNSYNDFFLDSMCPGDQETILDAQRTFGSALSTFYAMKNLTKEISTVRKEKYHGGSERLRAFM